jgi:hypothetical protein
MRSIFLFTEDSGHESFISAVVERVALENNITPTCKHLNSRGGHGRVVKELKQYIRDLERDNVALPDLLIIASDANCKGLHERKKTLAEVVKAEFLDFSIFAVPDPHIERWMMLDSHAFKEVFGRGCDAPDNKCEKDRYKNILMDEICKSGIRPIFLFERCKDIIRHMDFECVAQQDNSFKDFYTELKRKFSQWNS